MEGQEYIMKMQMMQQEAGAIEERMQVFDQQIEEMQSIKSSLDDLEKRKEGDEFLANLGKGIFIKTEIKSKELFVNTGKSIVVKKNIQDTLEVLDEQIKKLMHGKQELLKRIEEIQEEMSKMLIEAQKMQAKLAEKGEHSEDCKCEEPCSDCKCEGEEKK